MRMAYHAITQLMRIIVFLYLRCPFQAEVKRTVSGLDEGGKFSANTDLSSALLRAVDMLTEAQQEES